MLYSARRGREINYSDRTLFTINVFVPIFLVRSVLFLPPSLPHSQVSSITFIFPAEQKLVTAKSINSQGQRELDFDSLMAGGPKLFSFGSMT